MKKYILIFMIIVPHILFAMNKSSSSQPFTVDYLQNKKLQFPAENVICSRLAELSPSYHHFLVQERIAQFFAGKQMDYLFVKTVVDLALDKYDREFPGCNMPFSASNIIHRKLVSCSLIVIEQSCKK